MDVVVACEDAVIKPDVAVEDMNIVEAHPPCEPHHMYGGGAEKHIDFDDGFRPYLPKKMLEHGGVGAPSLCPLLPDMHFSVSRRKTLSWRDAAVNLVENGLTEPGRLDRVGALFWKGVVEAEVVGRLVEHRVGSGDVANEEGEGEEAEKSNGVGDDDVHGGDVVFVVVRRQ